MDALGRKDVGTDGLNQRHQGGRRGAHPIGPKNSPPHGGLYRMRTGATPVSSSAARECTSQARPPRA
jgi:hypothetical protein